MANASVPRGSKTPAGPRRIRGLDADQRRDQRRRQLLDSALELFAANGYANTSIEQLCQHAYVGTKGFYEIFDGRESCYIALLTDITERVEAAMVDLLATGPDDPREATRTLVAAFAHALVDDPRTAVVTFGQGGAISPAVERQRRANRRWAAGFIERVWDRHGLLPPRPSTDPHRVAIGLVGGMFDLIADWLLDADPGDPAEVDALVAHLNAFYDVVTAGMTSLSDPPTP